MLEEVLILRRYCAVMLCTCLQFILEDLLNRVCALKSAKKQFISFAYFLLDFLLI